MSRSAFLAIFISLGLAACQTGAGSKSDADQNTDEVAAEDAGTELARADPVAQPPSTAPVYQQPSYAQPYYNQPPYQQQVRRPIATPASQPTGQPVLLRQSVYQLPAPGVPVYLHQYYYQPRPANPPVQRAPAPARATAMRPASGPNGAHSHTGVNGYPANGAHTHAPRRF